jgi:hypothetical protein
MTNGTGLGEYPVEHPAHWDPVVANPSPTTRDIRYPLSAAREAVSWGAERQRGGRLKGLLRRTQVDAIALKNEYLRVVPGKRHVQHRIIVEVPSGLPGSAFRGFQGPVPKLESSVGSAAQRHVSSSVLRRARRTVTRAHRRLANWRRSAPTSSRRHPLTIASGV